MSDQTASYADEIDLFAVVHTLWRRKVLVLLAACAGLILGWGGSQFLPVTQNVSVPVSINYHSIKSGNLCADIETVQRCLSQVDFSSAVGFSPLTLKSQQVELRGKLSADQSAGTVLTRLEKLIDDRSRQMFEEATEHLAYAMSLGANHAGTETIAKEIMKARFIISQYQKGMPFAKLGAATLASARPTSVVIAAIAAVCMALLACMFVLIKTAHSNWKRSQSA